LLRKHPDLLKRARQLKEGRTGAGPVVYWMSRDQRADDNWALLYAQQEALDRQRPLLVAFCLDTTYPAASPSHFRFLLDGLIEVELRLAELHIGFALLAAPAPTALPSFLVDLDACLLVCDFDPLRQKRQWKQAILAAVAQPIWEVDAHNIIPVWTVSQKREYGAYTIRPKINRLLDQYLTDSIALVRQPEGSQAPAAPSTRQTIDRVMGRLPPPPLAAGVQAAGRAMQTAIEKRLPTYAVSASNPCENSQSGLSPYLHFGQLSAQRLALAVQRSSIGEDSKQAFLEELIVRRELADNYCWYEPEYDRFSAFPDWAKTTLNAHRADPRTHLYDHRQFEQGATHEALWNACQKDLVTSGKLHGFLRMYWAKKILEWSASPEEALAIAIDLNDRYSLDGRDPNGYAGIAWSIGGVHDRAWPERPVFGKVRFMNEQGCRRKFAVNAYIERVERK
jgi:deoxyribodipyrimidine photo-lyase